MHRFIVVTGLPGSGKSTVGTAVAAALELPLLDKDDILEALFDGLGVGDALWRTRLSRAADLVLQRLAVQSQGAVLASWWRHPRSQVESGTSTAWLRSLPGQVIELHCKCSPRIAVERFFARRRHAGHLDSSKSKAAELAKLEELASYGALGLGPLVELDTERPLELDILLQQLAVESRRC